MFKRLATPSSSWVLPSTCTCAHLRFASTSSASSTSSPSSSSSTTRATLAPPSPDISQVLNDPERVKRNLIARNSPVPPQVVDEVRSLELEAVHLRQKLQLARERRNTLSKSPKSTINTEETRREAKEIKLTIKQLEPLLASMASKIQSLALQLPNRSHPSSPVGDESQPRLVKTLGPSIPPTAIQEPSRNHIDVSSPDRLAWTDLAAASVISGNSWPLLTNAGAKLELALTQYALSIALSHNFNLVLPPDVIRSDIAERCGFQPRDGEAQQTYFLGDGQTASSALCLAGTAEVPLVAMNANTTFRADDLPRKIVGVGRAFRAEAGARGAESRGLYRVHQFTKVEMVVLCAEDQSARMLEELRRVQERILAGLGLSLRVLDMPTHELGVSAQRKYDIEAWMPGRGKWGELSSASNCTDYQARRLHIRYRPAANGRVEEPIREGQRAELEDLKIPTPAALEATALYPSQIRKTSSGGSASVWCHTLNATAAAVPRLIVAILENGVVLDEQGQAVRVRLPGCLKRWWLEGPKEQEDERIEWVEDGQPLRFE